MSAFKEEEPRNGLLGVGNWIIDRVKIIDIWPQQDALARILEQSEANGGCAYNTLKDLAIMDCGFPLFASGLVGEDGDGAWILDDLTNRGIDTRGLYRTPDAPTAYTDVMTVESTGRRTFFHQRGANALFSDRHCILENYPAKIVHLGYFGLLDQFDRLGPDGRNGHARLLSRASDMGFITSADLVSDEKGAFEDLVGPALPHLDYLFLNEFEAALLSGITASSAAGLVDPSRMEEQAVHTMEKGVREAVIVHSAHGVVAANKEGRVLYQGAVKVPPEQIRGVAGAGDALAAGVLLGIHSGWELPKSLELGVCAAGISLEAPSCSAALKPWEICLERGRERGFRTF